MIDEERIAALLDGRVSEEDRQALLAELARGGPAYEALVDTAAVLRELEAAVRRRWSRGADRPPLTPAVPA